jgi:hypothetical protein
MPRRSRLIIIEHLLPKAGGFLMANLADVELLVLSGGKKRSEQELRRLVEAAGLMPADAHIGREDMSALVCHKP